MEETKVPSLRSNSALNFYSYVIKSMWRRSRKKHQKTDKKKQNQTKQEYTKKSAKAQHKYAIVVALKIET